MTDDEKLAEINQRLNDIEQLVKGLDAKLKMLEPYLYDLHTWMNEMMPVARQAARMFEKRNSLLGLVTGANRRG